MIRVARAQLVFIFLLGIMCGIGIGVLASNPELAENPVSAVRE